MNGPVWLDSAFCVRLTLTLAHFLWQGALLAGVAALAGRLEHRPFDAACAELGITFERLGGWMRRMQQAGVLRRFAAILHQRPAGFSANGMGVWRVPDQNIENAGRIAAGIGGPPFELCAVPGKTEEYMQTTSSPDKVRAAPPCTGGVQGHGSHKIPTDASRWKRLGRVEQSQHPLTKHFGLGSLAEVDAVVVAWPNGKRTEVNQPAVDQYHWLQAP